MVRLRVPFAEKEEVKRLGARWNPSGKFWYYPGEELPEALSPWALQKAPGPSAEGGTGQLALAGLSELEAAEPFAAALTVSQLNERIRSSFRNDPFFTKIRVRGEVTNLNEKLAQDGSAHLYFSIKDSGAILNVVVWKTDVKSALAAPLKNGQMTAILGSVDFFAPQGKIQLRAELIRELGVGEAELALLMRKEKLEKEGLFREEFKKKIPVHPKSIGIVTSRNGQAIQDIQKVARKRNPYIQLYLYHVSV
ncbi:MAG: exodeoxyribonuclease VII large subunit, partial [Lachnospiraceae bacterium]|nr:exodeoxyribonuclease VII large subunit [Lachnospiraceae bacterium]